MKTIKDNYTQNMFLDILKKVFGAAIITLKSIDENGKIQIDVDEEMFNYGVELR